MIQVSTCATRVGGLVLCWGKVEVGVRLAGWGAVKVQPGAAFLPRAGTSRSEVSAHLTQMQDVLGKTRPSSPFFPGISCINHPS